MAARTTRWTVILACLAIPVAVIVLGWQALEEPPGLDPTYPPACEAVHRQVQGGDGDGAATAAAAVVSDEEATAEEGQCAQWARDRLGAAGYPADLATLDPLAARRRSLPSVEEVRNPLAPGCRDAATAARRGDITGARATYGSVLAGDGTVEEKACAVGGLARLPSRQTPSDVTSGLVDQTLERLTAGLPGGPLTIPPSSSAIVAGAAWFVTIGLLFVALRQFLRWRRERTPGTVTIETTKGDADDAPLPDVIRARLAEAGVFQTPFGGAIEDLIVDVTEVVESAGSTGPIGKVLTALKGVLAVQTGFTLSFATDTDSTGADGTHQLIAQLDRAQGGTITVDTYGGSSQRDAAANTAYGVFLHLSSLPDVMRRTPPSWRWTSIAAVRGYYEGLYDHRRGSYLRAIEKLEGAARQEPANSLVQSALADAHLALGWASDSAPSPFGPPTGGGGGGHYIAALVAALRAVELEGRSYRTHSNLARVLGSVDKWRGAWVTDEGKSQEVAELLSMTRHQRWVQRQVHDLRARAARRVDPTWDDLPHRLALALATARRAEGARAAAAPGRSVAGDGRDRVTDRARDAEAQVVELALKLAARHRRLALRRTRFWYVAYGALWLGQRRANAREVWIYRRRRWSVQDMLRAARAATQYDRLVPNPRRLTRLEQVAVRARLRVRLPKIRFGMLLGLRRQEDVEAAVQYQLGVMHARRADWLQRRRGFAPGSQPARPDESAVEARRTARTAWQRSDQDAAAARDRWRRAEAAEAAVEQAAAAEGGDEAEAEAAATTVAQETWTAWSRRDEESREAAATTWRAHRAQVDVRRQATFGQAVTSLDRSYGGSGHPLSLTELTLLSGDPDLEVLRPSSLYRSWLLQYRFDDAKKLERAAWDGAFTDLATATADARLWWLDHLAAPRPDGPWGPDSVTWAREVIGWFGEDVDRWTLLSAWFATPVGTSVREAFRESVPPPAVNQGRPSRSRTEITLPERGAPADLFATRRYLVSTPLDRAVRALDDALEAAADQDGDRLRRLVGEDGPRLAEHWQVVSTWARQPAGPAPPVPI